MLFNSKKSGFKLLSLLFVVGLTFAACSQDYDDQISDVTDQIAEEVTARSEAVAKLQSQLEALQATHAADIQKLQDADAKLSQAVADAEKAAKDYADKVAAAEADAAEAAAKAYADAQDKVILATAEAAAAEAEANAKAYTEAQIAALKAQLENEIAAAKKELTEKYDVEIAALKTKDAELQKAIDDAKAKAEKDLADAVKKIEDAHKADINRIDAAVAAIDARVKDIEAWEATAKTQIAANETAIAALKGDLAKEIADRQAADKALETALNTLGSKVDANYNELNGKIQANYEELKKADDALYAAIVDNAKKIKDLQDADVALGKRIDGVVADLEAAKKAIEEQIKKICGDIDDLYTKYDALNKAFEAYKTAQKATDAEQDKAIADLKKALADAIAAQAKTDAAQDKALADAVAKLEKAIEDAIAAQAKTDAAQDAALEKAIEDVTSAYNKAIAEAVKKVEGELEDAKEELQKAIDDLDAKLSAAIKVLSERPTTIIFKPYLFIGGIETFEFNPMYYVAYENIDNEDVTYVDGLVPTNFFAPTYVALPKEIEYEVNPWSTTIDYLDIYNTKFNFHVAQVRPEYGTRGEEAPYLSVNKAENYTPSIKNHILKFRVDESVVDGAAAWTKALDFGKVVMFAVEIPFAGEDTTVVSDYARLSECPFTAFFRVADADDKVYPLYNDSKKAIYEVTEDDVPVNVFTNDKFIYEIKGFKVGGENPTLLSLVNNAEFDAMKEPFVVDALRAEDLGFEYRFYVPREDEVEVNKSADVDEVFYKGPQYGPWGYAAAGTDFQKLIKSIDHKTGAVDFGEKAKGLTPIILIQIVDPKNEYQVVTEAYVRLVIEGDTMEDTACKKEKTGNVADGVYTYPNCEDEYVEIPYTAAEMTDSVYNKFGVNQAQFEKYWKTETNVANATPNSFVDFDEDGNLVAYIPYADLQNLNNKDFADYEIVYTATLGGNTVEITFNAHVILPTISLSYETTYWQNQQLPVIDERFLGTVVANPNPASEKVASKYCSFDFDLTSAYNAKKPVEGWAQDKNTGIYFKAETVNGKNEVVDITKAYADCISLDLVPARFDAAQAAWLAAATKYTYADGKTSTFADLQKRANTAEFKFDSYVDALQYRTELYGKYNVELKEADPATDTPDNLADLYKPARADQQIDTKWGYEAGITILDNDYNVPVQVICYYGYNETTDARVIDEWMLDYKKPLNVINNDKLYEIIDINHQLQTVTTADVIKLEDWLGYPVTAHFVAGTHTPGLCTPNELAMYYNVGTPRFIVDPEASAAAHANVPKITTDLEVNGKDLTHKCVVVDGKLVGEVPNGPLPDNTSVLVAEDGQSITYQNVGASVDQNYHMFVEVEVPHKWGFATGWIVIEVQAGSVTK